MTIKRVVFIRPGETDWNKEGRFQGWVAIPLNEHGRQQVYHLANYIRHLDISALYTSDLRRAKDTADILAERLGFEAVVDARLRERDIGRWQGLSTAEMRAWYPQEYEKLRGDLESYGIPAGESRADVRRRMKAFFDDMLKQDLGECVGVVSHTTAINTLLHDLLPPTDKQREAAISNGSVTTIKLNRDGVWQLSVVDDIQHLRGMTTSNIPSPGA